MVASRRFAAARQQSWLPASTLELRASLRSVTPALRSDLSYMKGPDNRGCRLDAACALVRTRPLRGQRVVRLATTPPLVVMAREVTGWAGSRQRGPACLASWCRKRVLTSVNMPGVGSRKPLGNQTTRPPRGRVSGNTIRPTHRCGACVPGPVSGRAPSAHLRSRDQHHGLRCRRHRRVCTDPRRTLRLIRTPRNEYSRRPRRRRSSVPD